CIKYSPLPRLLTALFSQLGMEQKQDYQNDVLLSLADSIALDSPRRDNHPAVSSNRSTISRASYESTGAFEADQSRQPTRKQCIAGNPISVFRRLRTRGVFQSWPRRQRISGRFSSFRHLPSISYHVALSRIYNGEVKPPTNRR